MQSAANTALALVMSSALFRLRFSESKVLWISFKSLFLHVYWNSVLQYKIYHPLFFLSFADCSYGECPAAAAAEAAWHEAFTIPPCWA